MGLANDHLWRAQELARTSQKVSLRAHHQLSARPLDGRRRRRLSLGPRACFVVAQPRGCKRHRSVEPMSDTSGKKLEFLREVVPGLRRLAIMANAGRLR
jgi:hypothetical protein